MPCANARGVLLALGRRPTRLLAPVILCLVVVVCSSAAPAAATRLPAVLSPSLRNAPADTELLWHNGCFATQSQRLPKPGCIFGDVDGRFRVALVGDSHASAWFPAIDRVAKARGWRVETFVKASCVPVDMPLLSLYLRRVYTECSTFLAATVKRLAAHPPDLLIVSASHISIFPARSRDSTMSAKVAAFARMIRKLSARRKVILGDVPYVGFSVPACLSVHRLHIESCAMTNWATRSRYGILDRGAAAATGATLIDLVRAGWCVRGVACPVVRGGIIAYRDSHHLTATFSRSMAPVLEREVERLFPGLYGDPRPTPTPAPTAEPTTEPTTSLDHVAPEHAP